MVSTTYIVTLYWRSEGGLPGAPPGGVVADELAPDRAREEALARGGREVPRLLGDVDAAPVPSAATQMQRIGGGITGVEDTTIFLRTKMSPEQGL